MGNDFFSANGSEIFSLNIKEKVNHLVNNEFFINVLLRNCDLALEVNNFNFTWQKFFDQSISTLKSEDWHSGVDAKDLPILIGKMRGAIYKKEVDTFEYRFYTSKKALRILRDVMIPQFDPFGSIIGLLITSYDVTETNSIKKSINQSYDILRFVFNSFPGSIFWKDINSGYLGCNKFFANASGFEDEAEIEGKTDFDLPWKATEAESYIKDDKLVMSTGIPQINIIETQHNKEGDLIWYVTNKLPLFDWQNKVIGVLGTAADITKQKQANLLLKKQLHYSHALNEISEAIIKQIDSESPLQTAGELTGNTLEAERVQIFSVDLALNNIRRISKWSKEPHKKFWPDTSSFDIALVRNANEYAIQKRSYLISHADNVNEELISDGSGEILHENIGIKSLLWYPFNYNDAGYYVLTISNLTKKINWAEEDINFLDSVTDMLTIALQKIDLVHERSRFEQELKESEDNLRTLIEALPEQVYFKDNKGCWIAANKAALEFYKLDKEEFKGKNDEELSHLVSEFKETFIHSKLSDIASLNSGRKIQFEKTIHLNNGNTVIIDTTKIPIYYENGATRGIVVIDRDITEEKRIQTELEKLSLAIEQSSVSVVITDTKGEIEYVNPKFSEITGYSFAEVYGKNPRILKAGGKTKVEYEELWNTIAGGRIWKGEFLNKRKDGNLFWEAATISPLKSATGEITNYLAIKEDITGKKALEINLKQALEKAEESDRFKSSLMANMSHEFRTPMNGILGLASILKDMNTDPGNKEMINGIILSGTRLMDTLASVLDLADLESTIGTKELHQVNISETITKVCNDNRQKAKAKKLSFNLFPSDEDLYVTANHKDLVTLFSKLIDNAIKFTEQGHVDIKIETEYLDNIKYVKTEILDTGIGISGNCHSKIFEDFRQASEGISRNYEGTGLGLSLVKKIVSTIKGKIFVDSEIGKGSVFTIYLPADETKNRMPVYNATIKYLGKYDLGDVMENKILVLLVEDNLINQQVTEMYLKALCEVHWARNGNEALDFANKNKYDIILMDINLGDQMDGIEVTKKIKTIPGYSKVPVVALTGYSMESDKKRFIANGLDYSLIKPFDKEELRSLIIEIISSINKAQMTNLN